MSNVEYVREIEFWIWSISVNNYGVRYDTENGVTEDILFCKPLETNTSGKYLLDTFIESASYDIDWTKYIGISIDGAKVMMGHRSGFIVKVQEIMPYDTWLHYF
ncbi:hypothetical protein WN55_02911 [Dufourea novaeangliae]|uniref:DUF4371 domain-containing protein n=1 Tax=Dufourea novaeangliae TaxID=178035 RepID=A0A154PIF8_DUFNO|nr:hypothetical protein WN55_02911 [Dufourea novaeangliae]